MEKIRNFSIIAHIDHGKSTLADRLLSICGSVENREMKNQILDGMDIEKERGITIKAQSVRMKYKLDGEEYTLNLIDTPGHVDFSYEVSRSLAACEGALLVVDATQGVEAQTIANVYMAIDNNLEIIPVVNKIDLPSSNPSVVLGEIEHTIGLDTTNHVLVSAKTGEGVEELIREIVTRIPPPKSKGEDGKTKALIYDSWFDNYLGALALVRVIEGELKIGQNVLVCNTSKKHNIIDLMYPHPIKKEKTKSIKNGEVGIVVLGLKDIGEVNVGDTITDSANPTKNPISGYLPPKPFVFAGLYPIETDKFEVLRESLSKLKLNDASIVYEPETSVALGFGFRVGFLGLLHMEVIKERLEREFSLDLIVTAPTVRYKVKKTDGETIEIQSPALLPEPQNVEYIEEPYVKATILLPTEYLGNIMKLLNSRRGVQEKMEYLSEDRLLLVYDIPSSEIVMDFYDKLKSSSKGYASFDYEPIGYKEGDLVKLDIRVAGEIVDALSIIVPRDFAYEKGKALVASMKELIPRQLFEVAIQASIGNKIISRETVKSMGKNVTAKCYGGDITRKRKLLEKQKKGKKRMKSIGKVDLPQEAFLSVLSID